MRVGGLGCLEARKRCKILKSQGWIIFWEAVTVTPAIRCCGSGGAIVVPNALAGVEGEINNAFPFGISFAAISFLRYQQVYAAA